MDTATETQTPQLSVADLGRGHFGIVEDDTYMLYLPDGELAPSFTDQNDAEHWLFEYRIRSNDPEPWITPSTQERSAHKQFKGFCAYSPRMAWPEQGGRMVRRDYLRVGDRAISSHYGIRTVRSVELAGTEAQTTIIGWVTPEDAPRSFGEIYPSDSMIELLPAEES